jgi:hypothetical protein
MVWTGVNKMNDYYILKKLYGVNYDLNIAVVYERENFVSYATRRTWPADWRYVDK